MRRCLVVVAISLALAGCGSSDSGGSSSGVEPKGSMELSSSAFANNAKIPIPYTCTGRNVSPPLRWTGVPAGTHRLALRMRDLDAHFVHWQVKSIDRDTTSVATGQTPKGGRAKANSFGTPGYSGPCPPAGQKLHHYVFMIIALSAKGTVLDRGSLTGTFGH